MAWQLPWSTKTPRMDDDQVQFLINTTTTTLKRSMESLYGVSHDGARDLKKVYGYPLPSQVDFAYCWTQYQSNGIAGRIVSMLPRSCWRDGAELFESEEQGAELLMAEDMAALDRAGLFRELEKADILNRLGQFSVMYIGLPDSADPEQPVGAVSTGKISDIYFAAYGEESVSITAYDTDIVSSRYGLPEMYQLTPGSGQSSSDKASDTRKPIKAHWSRVVHLAEGALDNGIWGIPALRPVINRCLDLDKVAGGAAEAFFRNAAQKLVMAIDKDATATAPELEAFQADAEAFVNQMKQLLGLRGSKISALEVPNADPTKSTEVSYQFISGSTGIPMRILTGEGAGQLAGNEDKASYNQLIADRQKQLCTHWLIAALSAVSKTGIITLPEEFVVLYPLPEAMDEKTASEVDLNKAKTAQALSDALSAYTMALGADSVIAPEQFLDVILRLETDEIKAITKALGSVDIEPVIEDDEGED